jgi:hypothetical protein
MTWRIPVLIGLDLDGLLDEQPRFFSFLTTALRAGNHFVAILPHSTPLTEPEI